MYQLPIVARAFPKNDYTYEHSRLYLSTLLNIYIRLYFKNISDIENALQICAQSFFRDVI